MACRCYDDDSNLTNDCSLKVSPAQLGQHLTQKLSSVYVISGDEPLQAMEAADALIAAARAQGYSEREIYHVETGFDWSALRMAGASMSLFAEKRIIDLRLPAGKAGKEGASVLLDWVEQVPEDTLLIVQCGQLERSIPTAKWFKQLTNAGVWVPVWPLKPKEVHGWVEQRMRQKGLQPERDAVALLSARIEGNLLAASQEIDMLALLCEQSTVTAQDVLDAVADSARFDVFQLVDAALMGNAARAVRVLQSLQDEDEKPPVILWALHKELSTLAEASARMRRGATVHDALSSVWAVRRNLVEQALKRQSATYWTWCLARCARLDRSIKGLDKSEVWHELLELTLLMAGRPMALTLHKRAG